MLKPQGGMFSGGAADSCPGPSLDSDPFVPGRNGYTDQAQLKCVSWSPERDKSTFGFANTGESFSQNRTYWCVCVCVICGMRAVCVCGVHM
jgi:hypothetical protein